MKKLIFAGGLEKRARPLTCSEVKQLIPVASKPVRFYAIESLVEAGIKEIGIYDRKGSWANAICDSEVGQLLPKSGAW